MHLTRIRPNFWTFQEKMPKLWLVRLEFDGFDRKMANNCPRLRGTALQNNPKVLAEACRDSRPSKKDTKGWYH